MVAQDCRFGAVEKIKSVYFREEQDDFETGFTGSMNWMRRHADYLEQHTQLLVKALEWEKHQKLNTIFR